MCPSRDEEDKEQSRKQRRERSSSFWCKEKGETNLKPGQNEKALLLSTKHTIKNDEPVFKLLCDTSKHLNSNLCTKYIY